MNDRDTNEVYRWFHSLCLGVSVSLFIAATLTLGLSVILGQPLGYSVFGMASAGFVVANSIHGIVVTNAKLRELTRCER